MRRMFVAVAWFCVAEWELVLLDSRPRSRIIRRWRPSREKPILGVEA
jgi:hypothetical protein